MPQHRIVTREEWLNARKQLLEREKEFTRARDALSAERRAAPWVRIDKTYEFDGPEGRVGLADLFGRRAQLIVYHFMFAPDWENPCKSCSFWADGYNGATIHLEHRDTRLVAISRAPREKLVARAQKMGWTFPWYSSSDAFGHDFGVTFGPEDFARGPIEYNYASASMKMTDLPGFSAFIKQDGDVYHTYSCYARGLDMLNPTYQLLDLTALGRQEDDLAHKMSWVRLHDEYAP